MTTSEEILAAQEMRESGFDDGYILEVLTGQIEPVEQEERLFLFNS